MMIDKNNVDKIFLAKKLECDKNTFVIHFACFRVSKLNLRPCSELVAVSEVLNWRMI